MTTISTEELMRCFREAATATGTILTLLLEKGVFTKEEYERTAIRMRAKIDQEEAQRKDERKPQ